MLVASIVCFVLTLAVVPFWMLEVGGLPNVAYFFAQLLFGVPCLVFFFVWLKRKSRKYMDLHDFAPNFNKVLEQDALNLNLSEQPAERLGELAEGGDAKAQYCYGLSLLLGIGVKADCDEANLWIGKSAKQGFIQAQRYMANLFYEDAKSFIFKGSKFACLYEQAAKQGDGYSQNVLGILYINGIGVKADFDKGMALIKQSAEQGEAFAQANYAHCLFQLEDFSGAVEWYKKSAKQDNWSGTYGLGFCYEFGFGVEQDYNKAIYWYRKSEKYGFSRARLALGLCYFYGKGVAKNLQKARELITRAADQGYDVAEEACKLLLSEQV